MANKVFDFLLSGVNSILRLGKGGNSLKSHNNSHIEFLTSNGDLLPVRTKTPVHLSDSVSLEFLRENVLLSYGLPVQNISELKAIPEVDRRDKQIRMVEDETTFYQYDEQSMAIVPDPDNPKRSVLPNDKTLAVPGRWLFAKGRTQYHTDLIGNDSGDDHPQYQLRNERDQPDGYLGLDSNSKLNTDTDRLDEGSSNQYFTGARARAETVDDSINPLETERAPSQRVVFDELATKEDSILGGTGFWDGTKTFRPVEITDIPGLELGIQGAYDAIGDLETNKEDSILPGVAGEFWDGTKAFRQILMEDILNLVSTLAGKEDTITASTSDKFLNGNKVFTEIEITDINGLTTGLGNKEPSIPSGVAGQYLTHDKTFKKIDYSEVDNTPPDLFPSGLTMFEIPRHVRLNIASIPLIASGNTTLNCSQASLFQKTGGYAIIQFQNLTNAQTIYLEIISTGSAYNLTFTSFGGESIKWNKGTQPTPTPTSGSSDFYTFIKIGSKIFATCLDDMK